LRKITPTKPVIITKGGRGGSGRRAAKSHTASLTSSTKVWQAAVAQAGALSAANFEEMVDLATTFYFLPPIPGPRVGITGGGGGSGVLAADQCEEAGLEVISLPDEIRQELKRREVPTWDWIGNPTDMSIREDDKFDVGDMLKIMAGNPNFDLLITLTGGPIRRGQAARSAKTHVEQFILTGDNRKALLAVVAELGVGIDNYDNPNWRLTAEVRTELIAAGIPIYPSIGRAANAASKVIDYYRKFSNSP
jgi:acyl-CoA synthetase (NDP forming)